VAKDSVITYADVLLPAGRLVDQLRAAQATELPARQLAEV
jgi:predicted homoserine dehydrogenase-like protein